MARMKQCKSCSKEIIKNAKICPSCGANNKKPFYFRGWFILIVVVVLFSALNQAGKGSNESANSTEQNKSTNNDKSKKENKKTEEKVPTEYKSALKKAKVYSDSMSMSKDKLYDQLTSEYGEKFSKEAAQYAIDNVKADWKENALKKAKTYQDSMSMSPSKILDQLTSEHGEKFTQEEAQYAVDNLK